MVEYIKREDAIEALGEEPYVWSDTDVEIAEHAQWVSDVKAIEAVPSADVQPVVRGHWVRKDSTAHGRVMRVCLCSVCKRNALINEDGFWELSNFCPNCGADMREEESE